jgi:halogenation protein CepH
MNRYDLVVVGAGPAGATLATVVALEGYRVLLLDREASPRYKIGESLLPATVRQLADVLGIRERIRNAGFVVKRGATFSWGIRPDDLWTMNFGRVAPGQRELPPNAPTSFNVPRHEFDQMFLENAVERGVEVRERCTVTAVREQAGTVGGVRYEDERGVAHEVDARIVALATGQGALSAQMGGTREYSTFFRKIGIFGYFEGAGRLQAPLDGNTFFETSDRAWLWHIPLSDRLTSIGAVVDAADAARVQRGARQALAHYIDQCPMVARMLSQATPCTTPPFDEVRTRSEYSYCQTRFWAPGIVRVGDAACFVDVLLSSGVHLATYGALLAARSVNAVLGGRLSEELAMNEFETRLRLEYALFYRGLLGLYDTGRDSQSYVEFLRRLLQNTNGVFIEWREQPRAIEPTIEATSDLLARSRSNVESLRAYNTRQVRYGGGAGFDVDEPPPAIAHTFVASTDGRHWAAASPAGVAATVSR